MEKVANFELLKIVKIEMPFQSMFETLNKKLCHVKIG